MKVYLYILKIYFILYVFYLHVYLCTTHVPGAPGVQKRVLLLWNWSYEWL